MRERARAGVAPIAPRLYLRNHASGLQRLLVPGLLPSVFASAQNLDPWGEGFALSPMVTFVAMGPPPPNALGLEWNKAHRTAPREQLTNWQQGGRCLISGHRLGSVPPDAGAFLFLCSQAFLR